MTRMLECCLLFWYLILWSLRMSTPVSKICETDVDIRFRKVWNRCQHLFRYLFLFCIVDVNICFREVWNRCQHPFYYFYAFFMYCRYQYSLQKFVKRMSTSILLFFLLLLSCEYRYLFQKFVKRYQNPFCYVFNFFYYEYWYPFQSQTACVLYYAIVSHTYGVKNCE